MFCLTQWTFADLIYKMFKDFGVYIVAFFFFNKDQVIWHVFLIHFRRLKDEETGF